MQNNIAGFCTAHVSSVPRFYFVPGNMLSLINIILQIHRYIYLLFIFILISFVEYLTPVFNFSCLYINEIGFKYILQLMYN